jgi:hypothetical protein
MMLSFVHASSINYFEIYISSKRLPIGRKIVTFIASQKRDGKELELFHWISAPLPFISKVDISIPNVE